MNQDMGSVNTIHEKVEEDAVAAPEPQENRRRSNRWPYVIEAWVSSPTATDPADKLEATAVNLSRHGICFDVDASLPVGCFYRIEVGIGEQRLNAEVRIISTRASGPNTYTIGAAFC
jgi:hypothetical protein